mmetsp:Transcript_56947/g.152068  ORF Transcript_56947/g.152068 Transcript_56947/m.152068 type:complete len:204 (-) Transcript_56947:89-700(-)
MLTDDPTTSVLASACTLVSGWWPWPAGAGCAFHTTFLAFALAFAGNARDAPWPGAAGEPRLLTALPFGGVALLGFEEPLGEEPAAIAACLANCKTSVISALCCAAIVSRALRCPSRACWCVLAICSSAATTAAKVLSVAENSMLPARPALVSVASTAEKAGAPMESAQPPFSSVISAGGRSLAPRMTTASGLPRGSSTPASTL